MYIRLPVNTHMKNAIVPATPQRWATWGRSSFFG